MERPPIADRASAVGRSLATSIERVLDGLPRTARGPQALAQALAVDKGFASRLMKAVRSRDPIAVMHLIPGPEPLRRLLRAAARRGVAPDVVREASANVERFAALIDEVAGDRSTFDGVVAGWLPDARRPFESRTKQLLYRGQSQLKGFSVDVDFTAAFLVPSADGDFVDYLVLVGVLGLRRLRPGVPVRLATWMMQSEALPWRLTTLDGRPLHDWSAGRLDRFCSAPPPAIDVTAIGDTRCYTLGEGGFGPAAAVDLVLAQRSRNTAPLYSTPPEHRQTGVGAEVDKPARRLHLDVFVHQTVFPGAAPQLYLTDTAFRGMANINDPRRAPDRYELTEAVQPLSGGEAGCRTAHIANYAEMLQTALDSAGRRLDEFRGYRCVIEYPVYGMQVTMGFQRPFPPAGDAPGAPPR